MSILSQNTTLFSLPFLRVEKLYSCQEERTKELSNLDEHLVVFQTPLLLVLKKVITNPFLCSPVSTFYTSS